MYHKLYMSRSSIKLLIDSAKRANQSESSTNFQVDLWKQISGYSRLTLESLKLPVSWYNCNASGVITHDGTPYTITLTGRYRDIDMLCSSLEYALLNEVGISFSVVCNAHTGKITIATGDSSNFSLTPAGALWQRLGIASSQSGSAAFVTFSNPHKLYTGDDYIYLQVGGLNGNILNIDQHYTPATFTISLPNLIDRHYGEMIETITNPERNSFTVPVPGVELESLVVQLRDQSGTQLSLNDANWQCMLRFS